MLSNISVDVINAISISELEVLKYIDNNKEQILESSIQALSQKLFVSTATIMRLCKKIGFSGFSEFKFFLREELKKEKKIESGINFKTLVERHTETLVKNSQMIDEEKIEKTIALMRKAGNFHFFGKGLSYSILMYCSKLLLTKGVANFIYEDTHISYLAAEKMNQNDLVFLCSLSGNTHQVIRMGQLAKSRGATVITITTNQPNELSKIGDVNFGILMDEELNRPADIASRLPILYVLNIIMILYTTKN